LNLADTRRRDCDDARHFPPLRAVPSALALRQAQDEGYWYAFTGISRSYRFR
jgi:hypothetical protein